MIPKPKQHNLAAQVKNASVFCFFKTKFGLRMSVMKHVVIEFNPELTVLSVPEKAPEMNSPAPPGVEAKICRARYGTSWSEVETHPASWGSQHSLNLNSTMPLKFK